MPYGRTFDRGFGSPCENIAVRNGLAGTRPLELKLPLNSQPGVGAGYLIATRTHHALRWGGDDRGGLVGMGWDGMGWDGMGRDGLTVAIFKHPNEAVTILSRTRRRLANTRQACARTSRQAEGERGSKG